MLGKLPPAVSLVPFGINALCTVIAQVPILLLPISGINYPFCAGTKCHDFMARPLCALSIWGALHSCNLPTGAKRWPSAEWNRLPPGTRGVSASGLPSPSGGLGAPSAGRPG